MNQLETVINGILAPLFKLIPNRNRERELETQVTSSIIAALTAMNEANAKQNQLEAQHRSVFVAGWRPAVGWICAVSLLTNYLVQPLVVGFGFPMPELNIGELVAILIGMLGLGGYRTYEKRIGVTK